MGRSFVAAGSGEATEGGPSYEGRIIRHGDQSPEAMREKALFVLGAMEQRMAALGFGWAEVTATQVYTIFNIHPLLADEIVHGFADAAVEEEAEFEPSVPQNIPGVVVVSAVLRVPPFSMARAPEPNESSRTLVVSRGTDSSNPSPSSGESPANRSRDRR
jgi:hypothetical protein